MAPTVPHTIPQQGLPGYSGSSAAAAGKLHTRCAPEGNIFLFILDVRV